MSDLFGRLRVSAPYTLLDSKCVYDNQPYLWDDQQVSGSGTSSTYNTNQASVTLRVSASTAGSRVRQTIVRPNYQPGKSQMIFMTGVIGAVSNSGITKRWGTFDSGNGLFFEISGGVLKVVRRSSFGGSPQDYPVAQTAWNIDTLDASSSSGIRLDTAKSNIYFINYEWLGVGDVVFGIVVDTKLYPCHRIKTSNIGTGVYMSTPNLPLRAEITNSGAAPADSLTIICGSVVSEGGSEPTGYVRSIDRGTNKLVARADGNTFVALALRTNPTFAGATIFPTNINIVSDGSDPYLWQLVLNPTITGSALTYANTDSVQANIPGNASYASGGTVVLSGYGQGVSTSGPGNSGKGLLGSSSVGATIPPSLSLGQYIDGTSTVYAVTFKSANLGGPVSGVFCSLTYNGTV